MKKLVYHSIPLRYDYLLDKEPTSLERQKKYFLHMHNDYEILYFFDGNAEYAIENVVYPLSVGLPSLISSWTGMDSITSISSPASS